MNTQTATRWETIKPKTLDVRPIRVKVVNVAILDVKHKPSCKSMSPQRRYNHNIADFEEDDTCNCVAQR